MAQAVTLTRSTEVLVVVALMATVELVTLLELPNTLELKVRMVALALPMRWTGTMAQFMVAMVAAVLMAAAKVTKPLWLREAT